MDSRPDAQTKDEKRPMPQKKGRGKVPGLSGYYTVVITSSSGKGTGNKGHHIEAKEPGLAHIIRLNRRVMDLGAQSDGHFAKGYRRLAHPKAHWDGVLIAASRFPVNQNIGSRSNLPEVG